MTYYFWKIWGGVLSLTLLAVVCLVKPYAVQGQVSDAPRNFVEVFPPSPAASSMGQFEDVPVSLYTGKPNISVPIWQAQGRGITLPISLDYHASGVRLSEVAPAVGMNWALTAGGVVTRTVMGRVDDLPGGYLQEGQPVPDQFTTYGEFEALTNGLRDGQPDIFSFSLPGASGKFVINYDGTVLLFPFQKIDIQYQKTGTEITRWTITTTDGTEYTLDENERQQNTTLETNTSSSSPSSAYNSSWFLSRIETPQGETINFSYAPHTLNYQLQDSETRYTNFFNSGSCGVLPRNQYYRTTTLIQAKRLTQIEVTSSDEIIDFFYEEDRFDLDQDQALTRITITNLLDEVVREFTLGYQYLQGAALVTPSLGTTPDDLVRRLMLTSVTESNNGVSKPAYTFEYITQNATGRGLPPRLSTAQDHWGFFNNTINTTLCPRQNVTQFVNGQTINFTVTGGIRSPDATQGSSLVGVLNKITYPTGGYTALEYEPHDYFSPSASELMSKSFMYTIANEFEGSVGGVGNNIDQFEVGANVDGPVYVNFAYPDDITINPASTWMKIFPLGSTTPVYFSQGFYNATTQTFQEAEITLAPGIYEIEYSGISRTTLESGQIFDLCVDWFEEVMTPERMIGGGARVAKTTLYDPVAEISKIKRYQYLREDGSSSGALLDQPEYGYVQEMIRGGDCVSGGQSSIGLIWVRSPTPNYTLDMTQGSYIGYSRVVVLEGEDGENGHSIYQYTSPATHPDMADVDDWPAAPDETREWQRGLLRESAQYEQGQTAPIQETTNNYTYFTRGSNNPNTLNQFVQAAKIVAVCLEGCLLDATNPGNFQANYYVIGTGYNEVNRSDEVLRSQVGGTTVTTQTDYTYSQDHLQLTRQATTDSEGRTRATEYEYAEDFTENGFGSNLLRRDHMHSQVLLQIDYTQVGGSEEEVQRLATTYSEASGHVLPSFATYHPKGVAALESITTSYSYDAAGNLTRQQREDENAIAYRYGYNNRYPVVQAENAEVNEIFYTSFEETDQNVSTTQARTGQQSHVGTYTVTLPPAGGSYLLTYWLKESETTGEWTFFSQTITANTDIGIPTNLIDEVRVHPLDALMTTYTYSPLRGMTSQTDPSGRTTYYEYDELSRVKIIRDTEREIVSRYQYHYANQ